MKMTKRERAIAAGWEAVRAVTSPAVSTNIAFAEAYHAVMSEPDEPPEGKLRVRVCVGVLESGVSLWHGCCADEDGLQRSLIEGDCAPLEAQFRWIEADVTPWQPPAEETVQGREVDYD